MRNLPLFRALILVFLLHPFSLGSQTAAGTSRLVLEDGTPVRLRLSQNLSSADARTGDQVDFEVLEEIRLGDLVVVPKGGIAWGTVTEAQPKKLIGGGGKLNVTIDHVRLASGEKAALRAVKDAKRGGQAGTVTTGTAAASPGPFESVFHLVYGKDITIPKGTEIAAYVNGNFEIVRSKFQSSAPVPAAPPEQAAPGRPKTRRSGFRCWSHPPRPAPTLNSTGALSEVRLPSSACPLAITWSSSRRNRSSLGREESKL